MIKAKKEKKKEKLCSETECQGGLIKPSDAKIEKIKKQSLDRKESGRKQSTLKFNTRNNAR